MIQLLVDLFGSSTWEPYGQCFGWTQPLLGQMVIANLLIGSTYLSIPFILIQLIRKRKDLMHKSVVVMFAIFIIGCGIGHFVKLWTIYEPVYRLQGWVDSATALASTGTAIMLWPLLPTVLKMPSNSQLQTVNAELEREVQMQQQAQTELQQTNEVLEFRVQERTRELERSNAALRAEIEERKEIEKALRLAQAAAEEAGALKSEFLGMVSHELRTPLTSIMGFASTLLAEDVTFAPEIQREFIGVINQESGKLKDLVEQLLDVTRIQGKVLRIQPRPQPLDNAMEIAGAQLMMITQKHLLESNVANDLPLVNVDEKRIGQVIVNLVDNAVKFSPVGTCISLSAAKHDDEVQITVTDEGIGIPETQREWIFAPFRQVGEQFTSRGTGLGLAICKGLVEAHGGRIWIESGENGGTRVVFTLPIAE